ncbi:MAG: autotransporter outer membrane beta-barrel domain-containing protein, partial [Alphaproteobacteria bacterium]|nr:autotransporter outer membrane beta-barrel domain-containing protein [Alphaproteobacteria bacterium]
SGSTATATIGISTTSSTIINDRIAALRTGIVETGMAAGNAIGMTAARLWGQAFGAQAEQDRRQGIAGYDADTYGMIVGMDADMTDAFRAGIAFSYASTDVDSQNVNTGNTDINSYQIALYGDYDLGGDMFVNAQLGYMRSNIDTLRLNVGGVAGNSARGDFYSNQYIVRAELGRDIRASRNAVLTPSLFVNYNHISFENYTETGAGGLALRNVDTDNMNIFELGVNVKNEWTFMDGMGGYIKPNIHGGFRYDFVNDEVQTSAALVGGGAAFQTTGFEPAKHTINVGAGLSWDAGNNWEVSTNYDFEYKDDYDAHSGYVRVGYKF